MIQKPQRIVMFTTSESASDLIDICHRGGYGKVIAVVYPKNRRNTEKVEYVKQMAKAYGLPVIEQPYKDRVDEFDKILDDLGAGLGISWSYSQVLQPSTLNRFPLGIWNMHGGRIPEYRGANVLQWAIANGERELGVTWHIMREEIDAGEILAEDTVNIEPEETALDARAKIFAKGIELFEQLWKKFICGNLTPKPPDLSKGRMYPPRKPIHGMILRNMTYWQIKNLLRAQCPPWPSPYLVIENQLRPVLGVSLEKTQGDFEFHCASGSVFLHLGDAWKDDALLKESMELLNKNAGD